MCKLGIGEKVAIRGDIRRRLDGKCVYAAEQLAAGKWVKRNGTDAVWIGKVEAIDGDMVKVGGGWRGLEYYTPVSDLPDYLREAAQ